MYQHPPAHLEARTDGKSELHTLILLGGEGDGVSNLLLKVTRRGSGIKLEPENVLLWYLSKPPHKNG